MLQTLRKSTASLVAKALFFLLILSFGAWGIQGYIFQAQQGDAVATVGEAKITAPELALAFRRDIRRFQQSGINLTQEQAREMGLLDQSLDRLIAGRLYTEAGDWLGLAVSDRMVSTQIRKEPAFFDENQAFSRTRFEALLSQAEYSEAQFVADVRRDILRRHILNSLDMAGDAPLALAQPLNSWRGEQRVAVLTEVPVDQSLDVGEPDEQAVQELYEEMEQHFTAPEYRIVSYVHISPEGAMRDVAVTDEQVQERYESRIDEFHEPRKSIVEQIRFADEDTAHQASEALTEGRPFDAVAEEFGTADGSDLEFGRFAEGEFPLPEIADAIDSLDVGGVSGPVQSAFGWHIFRLAGFEEERTQPLEEVREQIEEEIRRERVGDVVYDLSVTVQDSLAGGATLDQAADSAGLEVRQAGPLDASGLDRTGERVTGLPGGNFLDVAFATASGTVSQMIETGDGGYFMLRTDDVIPAALRPLDEVRDEVVAIWQQQRRRDAARERALNIVEKVESGTAIEAVADGEGLTVSESKPFDRSGTGAESEMVTPTLVSDIFRLEPGQATMADSPNGFVVASLKEIVPADGENVDELATSLGDALVSDVIVQFNNALRERLGVEVNQSAIVRIF